MFVGPARNDLNGGYVSGFNRRDRRSGSLCLPAAAAPQRSPQTGRQVVQVLRNDVVTDEYAALVAI